MVYIHSIYTGLIVFPFIAAVYIFFIGVVRLLYPDFEGHSIYGEVYSWSFFCILSLVQVLIMKGATLGHAACRMILVSEDGGAASAGQLIKRYLYLWLFTEVPLIIADWLMGERFSFIIDVMIIVLHEFTWQRK